MYVLDVSTAAVERRAKAWLCDIPVGAKASTDEVAANKAIKAVEYFMVVVVLFFLERGGMKQILLVPSNK